VKPIIFLLGPSGSGKTHTSKMLKKEGFLYVHIDTDSERRTFAAYGLPPEWDDDFHNMELASFVDDLLGRLGDEDEDEHTGTVVSFPTVFVFTPDELEEAERLGVTPVILWGEREYCIRAAKSRREKKPGRFNSSRYDRLNKPTFQAFGSPEYAPFRVEAFQKDGSRHTNEEEWLRKIMARAGV